MTTNSLTDGRPFGRTLGRVARFMIITPSPALWLNIDGRLHVLAGGPALYYYREIGARLELGDYASSGVIR